MAKTTIMSVWEKLLSEGADASTIDASKYINECAAGVLSDIMNEEEPPVISIEDEEITPTAEQSVVTVYYEDPDGTCDYDDEIISASNKDDIDGGGWGKGLRVVNFIYDSSEDAIQASSQISDIEDVPGLTATVSTPDDSAASDDVGNLPEITDDEDTVVDSENSDEIGEGKDEGKPGKNFKKIEDKASEEYGSKEAGEKVAGAVLSKLRKEHPEEYTESKKRVRRSILAPVDVSEDESTDTIKISVSKSEPTLGRLNPTEIADNAFFGKVSYEGKEENDNEVILNFKPVSEVTQSDIDAAISFIKEEMRCSSAKIADEDITEDTENDLLIVKFKSDGDETAVDEFKDYGFDIKETYIDEEGNRVIVINAKDALPDDLAKSAQDVLRGLGVTNYTMDVEEDEKVEEDVTTDEDGVVTTDETPEETLDALQADLDALRIELSDAGILDGETDGSDEDISLASLEESFLGYEEVKGNQPSELNSKTGFGSDDGKSPVLSRPIKDRKPDGEPIKVKTENSSDDGTHLTAAPATKELPPTKNNIKSLRDQYKTVGKETGAKLNSKDGFGEEGKKSIVD